MARCRRPLSSKLLLLIAVAGLTLGVGRLADRVAADDTQAQKAEVPAVLDYTMNSLEGDEIELKQYYGDVVLIVNVASKCGLTPQYKGLQKLHEDYAEKGLSILGFPANNFGKQEPGTNKEIGHFCQRNYGVEFDMFAKISVAGDDQTPLYTFLTDEETNGDFAGKINWNFEKFLVNREGEVIARFAPRTKPTSKEVLKAIKEALAEPMPEDAKKMRAEAEAAEKDAE